ALEGSHRCSWLHFSSSLLSIARIKKEPAAGRTPERRWEAAGSLNHVPLPGRFGSSLRYKPVHARNNASSRMVKPRWFECPSQTRDVREIGRIATPVRECHLCRYDLSRSMNWAGVTAYGYPKGLEKQKL